MTQPQNWNEFRQYLLSPPDLDDGLITIVAENMRSAQKLIDSGLYEELMKMYNHQYRQILSAYLLDTKRSVYGPAHTVNADLLAVILNNTIGDGAFRARNNKEMEKKLEQDHNLLYKFSDSLNRLIANRPSVEMQESELNEILLILLSARHTHIKKSYDHIAHSFNVGMLENMHENELVRKLETCFLITIFFPEVLGEQPHKQFHEQYPTIDPELIDFAVDLGLNHAGPSQFKNGKEICDEFVFTVEEFLSARGIKINKVDYIRQRDELYAQKNENQQRAALLNYAINIVKIAIHLQAGIQIKNYPSVEPH